MNPNPRQPRQPLGIPRAKLKVGFVSTPENCVNHIKALAEEGWDCHCLGGDPLSIPPSFDVLVCRTTSCSHGASWLAMAWGSERGENRLILADGLSTIRKELDLLAPSPKTRQELPPMRQPRPFWESHWPKTPAWVGFVGKNHFRREVRALEREIYPLMEDDFPAEVARIHSLAGEGRFTKVEQVKNQRLLDFMGEHLFSKPVRFYIFWLAFLPDDAVLTRLVLRQVYMVLCGKGTDGRTAEAALWLYGLTFSNPDARPIDDVGVARSGPGDNADAFEADLPKVPEMPKPSSRVAVDDNLYDDEDLPLPKVAVDDNLDDDHPLEVHPAVEKLYGLLHNDSEDSPDLVEADLAGYGVDVPEERKKFEAFLGEKYREAVSKITGNPASEVLPSEDPPRPAKPRANSRELLAGPLQVETLKKQVEFLRDEVTRLTQEVSASEARARDPLEALDVLRRRGYHVTLTAEKI